MTPSDLSAWMLDLVGARTERFRRVTLTFLSPARSYPGDGALILRLANALSALYPKDCEEKRLLDAMLLAVPR